MARCIEQVARSSVSCQAEKKQSADVYHSLDNNCLDVNSTPFVLEVCNNHALMVSRVLYASEGTYSQPPRFSTT